MAIRTRVYPFEIVVPEVIEDANVTKEYAELLEEVTRAEEDIPVSRLITYPPHPHWRYVLLCPVCDSQDLLIIAVATVTDSACILTTANGTKIIRGKNLGEKLPGTRLVAFLKCEYGHITKMIYQNDFDKIYCQRGKVRSEKVKKLVDGFLSFSDLFG